MRGRLVVVIVLTLAAAAIPASVGAAPVIGGAIPESLGVPLLAGTQPAPAPAQTRVRLRLETTSAWAGIDVLGTAIAVRRVAALSPGARITVGSTGFSIKGPVPTYADVDAVLDVPANAAPALRVRKGYSGTARGIVVRTVGTHVTVADVLNERRDGDYTIQRPVDRALLVGPGLQIPRIDPRPLALAFYYPWFTKETFNQGFWQDTPSGPYDTNDPAQVAAVVDQAAGAGIDGFIVSWNGEAENTKRFDYVLSRVGTRPGFLVSAIVELGHARTRYGIDVQRAESLVRGALSRASHAAFLRVGARPVIFLFGASGLAAGQWSTIRQNLRASGLDPFVVSDAHEQGHEQDGYYIYSPNHWTSSDARAAYGGIARSLRLPAQVDPAVPQRLWAATVSPGQNDTYIRPTSPTIQQRRGGARYAEIWDAALASRPEWVLVTSWNEWFEATHIAPGRQTGTGALYQTADWTRRFDAR